MSYCDGAHHGRGAEPAGRDMIEEARQRVAAAAKIAQRNRDMLEIDIESIEDIGDVKAVLRTMVQMMRGE